MRKIRFVLVSFIIMSLLFPLASCFAEDEVVLRTDFAPYFIYYGSRGKPSEEGQKNVTLMEYHCPYAVDSEQNIMDLDEEELEAICEQFSPLLIYDFWEERFLDSWPESE